MTHFKGNRTSVRGRDISPALARRSRARIAALSVLAGSLTVIGPTAATRAQVLLPKGSGGVLAPAAAPLSLTA